MKLTSKNKIRVLQVREERGDFVKIRGRVVMWNVQYTQKREEGRREAEGERKEQKTRPDQTRG